MDYSRFPLIELAIDSVRIQREVLLILNAANEIAVTQFLEGKIKYIDIPKIIERCLNKIHFDSALNYDSLVELDQQTRDYARTICQHGSN